MALNQSRRGFLKTGAVIAGATAASMGTPRVSQAAETDSELMFIFGNK